MEEERLKINIYLDESRIDNPESNFMVVGGAFVAREKVRNIQKKIAEIKEKHGFRGEIKWVKTDDRKLPFLRELTTYLLELPSQDFSFHCIVVKKDEVNYDKYHGGDRELAFFKFIYELLRQRLRNNKTYYIFLDYKPTKVKERVHNLHGFLERHLFFYNNKTDIKHLQSYSSEENVLIQVADLFSGAVAYHFNNDPADTSKDTLAVAIANKIGHDRLFFSSPKGEDKFNIFKIILS